MKVKVTEAAQRSAQSNPRSPGLMACCQTLGTQVALLPEDRHGDGVGESPLPLGPPPGGPPPSPEDRHGDGLGESPLPLGPPPVGPPPSPEDRHGDGLGESPLPPGPPPVGPPPSPRSGWPEKGSSSSRRSALCNRRLQTEPFQSRNS